MTVSRHVYGQIVRHMRPAGVVCPGEVEANNEYERLGQDVSAEMRRLFAANRTRAQERVERLTDEQRRRRSQSRRG